MAADSCIHRVHYSAEIQAAFAQLSGDYNPIHTDPVAARRTLVGALVVHGLHHVLAGWEALLGSLHQAGRPRAGISSFSAQFLKPVLVGESVDFFQVPGSPEEYRLEARIGHEVMCRLSFRTGEIQIEPGTSLPPVSMEAAREVAFAQATGLRGDLVLGLDAGLAAKLFPNVLATAGAIRLAETLALTRLVGMHLPGLHSLFSQATVKWAGAAIGPTLHYEVEQADERFGRVIIQVKGPRLEGKLTAFFRPPPEPQPPMEEVASRVEPNEFMSTVALIIGGSRGIGEITAKVIAAGGGLPIVTYHQGAGDAERLAHEIRGWGGRCEFAALDILNGSGLRQHFTGQLTPTSLYYFATPKIGLRRGFFSSDMLALYLSYYVTAFGRLLSEMALPPGRLLRVFYPSSIYVTAPPREMAEYAMAKRAGEDLCAFYNQHARDIAIVVERLPRMHTDQTRSLIPIPAEEALSVMLPVIRKVEGGQRSL